MNIIIFGEMGSGKSTVAKYIKDKFDYKIFSLGSKIHSECKLHGKETRQEMQKYGQMMRQIFGENVWCDYLVESSCFEPKIVIDDARQLNEYDYFSAKGYLPIAVITDNDIRLERLSKRVNYQIDPATFNHDTEVQVRECVKKCDIKLYNNGTKEQLHKQIDLIEEMSNVHI